MKTKCVAILMAFGTVIAHASAQPYSIRANRGLNFRVAPSLNADIADTVVSGAILQVVGKSGGWLKIDRHGREVWLADWVNFSRVDSGEPSGSQQPAAQIDNCCFVDRQCQSDHEWIDGYWAYQNGQCAAPVQPSTPAQPVASAPAVVDNCCFVDRQCNSAQDWIDGFWAYQNQQCGAPSQAQPAPVVSSRPRVEGSARFIRRVEASLDLMQRSAPAWYDYVSGNVDLIREVPDTYPDCTAYRAFVYFEPARNVYVETCMAIPPGLGDRGRPIHMAGTLAHEACHRRHQHEGVVYAGGIWEEELECSKPSQAVTRALDPAGRYIRFSFDPEFVLARLRATNCFATINSYDEFYRVLENFYNHQGADYNC